MNLMARKTSSDSGRRVSGIIFRAIQDSFTTQWVAGEPAGPRRQLLSLPSFAREPPAPVETLSHRTRWAGLAERCDALRAVLQ